MTSTPVARASLYLMGYIAVVLASTLLVFLNPIAEQLTGWPTDAAIGRPLREILVLRDAEPGSTAPGCSPGPG